ncbi:MAG: enoyl-ACP reductase FabV [Culicoidibacterales bacterium]
MIITPKIRNSVALNCHPLGCGAQVIEQINYTKQQPKFVGPKNALIIGGSTGFGLASRIALAFGADTNTLNVSFEREAGAKKTGTAGFWNNLYFQSEAKKSGLTSVDIQGDAFTDEIKTEVIATIQAQFPDGIDLLVYSVAAPRRTDPETGITYDSQLKPVGKAVEGYTLNFTTDELDYRSVEPASEEEITATIKVMGGEDWQRWIDQLQAAGVLNHGFKTIAYSYLGPEVTYAIYQKGALGTAKAHLAETATVLDQQLAPLSGEAAIVVDKAIVSRASAYIPMLNLYVATVFKVMENHGKQETTIAHKYRFFSDMLYGTHPEIDEQGFYRPDAWEMDPTIQAETNALLEQLTPENFKDITSYWELKHEFNMINGFDVPNVDYTTDVDLLALITELQA